MSQVFQKQQLKELNQCFANLSKQVLQNFLEISFPSKKKRQHHLQLLQKSLANKNLVLLQLETTTNSKSQTLCGYPVAYHSQNDTLTFKTLNSQQSYVLPFSQISRLKRVKPVQQDKIQTN